MDKKLVKAFNEQINKELYSAYLYLSMAAWCESANLPGFAHWMKLQAQEETGHAMKIFGFLNQRGERVVLEAISKPPVNFASPKGVFEQTLKHEKKVTGLINKLYQASNKAKDSAAAIFLQWFVSEQVEEESNAASILDKFKTLKSDSGTLLMLDQALGKRGAD